jgi:glycosyltransferase involved in cell wall biosynthesis
MTQSPEFSIIMPVYNAMAYLGRSLMAIETVMEHEPDTELILVDNGSTDGSHEFLLEHQGGDTRVLQNVGARVGGLRNFGAANARGKILVFIDADCVIVPDYITQARRVLSVSGADATGCQYALPEQPHWIEQTWADLHRRHQDGAVNYLNAGNFVIRRDVFEALGGFDQNLISGEDAELGARLVEEGFRMHEAQSVRAVHLGNPKSIARFYRQQLWHGLGMLGTTRVSLFDKPILATAAFVLLTILGIVLPIAWPASLLPRLIISIVCVLAVPVAAVAFRVAQGRRSPRFAHGVLLYWVYLAARSRALWQILWASKNGDARRWARTASAS